MNVPMNDELKKQLINETTSMQETATETNNKLHRIITAAKNNTITINGPGFDLEVYAAIPGPLKDKLWEAKCKLSSLSDTENFPDIRKIIVDVESQFMARMCVDSELRCPEAWIEFENETGLLDELVECIIGENTAKEEDVKHFRRKH